MITFLKEAACEGRSGRASSARVISLMAGSALSFSTVLLSVGSFWRPEMLSTLTAFGPSLAGLAAGNYMIQKWAGTRAKTDE